MLLKKLLFPALFLASSVWGQTTVLFTDSDGTQLTFDSMEAFEEWAAANNVNVEFTGNTCELCGISYADPHIYTYDDAHYQCQGKGDFILSESTNSNFKVQGRFFIPDSGLHSGRNGSSTVGAVMETGVGNEAKIEMSIVPHGLLNADGSETHGPSDCNIHYWVNGVRKEYNQADISDSDHQYEFQRREGSRQFKMTESNVRMKAVKGWDEVFGCHISLYVCVPCDFGDTHDLRGIFGTPNKDKTDDFMTRTGQTIAQPPKLGEQTTYCRDNWCVGSVAESLFLQPDIDAKCTSDPSEGLDKAVDDADDKIKRECEGEIDCITDTVVTGDLEIGKRTLEEKKVLKLDTQQTKKDTDDVEEDYTCGEAGMEFAYAKPQGGASCFSEDGWQGKNQWGWVIEMDGTMDFAKTFDVYAGATGCDTTKGDGVVGKVTIIYQPHTKKCAASYVSTTDPQRTIGEFHFHCAGHKYPMMNDGTPSLMGAWFKNSGCEDLITDSPKSDTCLVTNVSPTDGKVYAIARAVSCNLEEESVEETPPTFDEEPPPTFDEEPPPTFDEEPPPTFDEEPPPTFDEEPPPTFDEEPPPTFDEEPPPTFSDEEPPVFEDTTPKEKCSLPSGIEFGKYEGNPQCVTDFGFEYGWKMDGCVPGVYTLDRNPRDGVEVKGTCPEAAYVEVVVTCNDDKSATLSWNKHDEAKLIVKIKGGPGGELYDTTGVTSGKFFAPRNNGGSVASISHIEFCLQCDGCGDDNPDDEFEGPPPLEKGFCYRDMGSDDPFEDHKTYQRKPPYDEPDGSDYRGTVHESAEGVPCQRWDSQTPHPHSMTPESNPGKGLESNYCRNPDGRNPNGKGDSPWCYTTDSDIEWRLCEVGIRPVEKVAHGTEVEVNDVKGVLDENCQFKPEQRSGPTPAPSKKGSGSGDPHFKTWTGEKYDYHGECDLVLVDNPSFADGLGLKLHIRTRRVKHFSFIEKAALQIGTDVLEFDNDVENFLINGAKVEANRKHHKTMLGPYQLRRDPKAISVRLADGTGPHKHTGAAKIDFHSRKNGFPAVIVDGGSSSIFEGSLGLLGDWGTGRKLARDGVTEIEVHPHDGTAFALEWQVRDTDPMLFQEARYPQYPTVCTPPAKQINRLGATDFRKEAEEACAHWKDDIQDCIFDVMATRDVLVAEEGHIVHVQ